MLPHMMRSAFLLILLPMLALAIDPDPEPKATTSTDAAIVAGVEKKKNFKPSIEEVLSSAYKNNHQIKEASQDIEIARADLNRARAAAYPKAEGLLLAAPMVQITGDVNSSQIDWSKWGPLVSGKLGIVQPLYTFGQISGYQKAAENQMAAREGTTQMKRNEIVLVAKEFYYGYQMANDLLKLVDSLVSFLEEAVEAAEKKKGKRGKKKKGGVRKHDLYRLKTELADLKQKRMLAVSGKQTAERAVSWVSELDMTGLPNKKLKPEKFELKTLDEYLEMAARSRPEIKALDAGKRARAALRDAKRAQSYPVLFLGAYVSHSWTSAVTDQQSFFAFDPLNNTEGGVGLGLRFDLEFARHHAEASKEEAERIKLEAQESWAIPGITLQVKKAFWELEQAIEGLKVAKKRKRMAKKWFVSSAMGWSIGVTAPKDLMEALEGRGKADQNYIETLYAHNMALAKLSAAVGREVTQLKYP